MIVTIIDKNGEVYIYNNVEKVDEDLEFYEVVERKHDISHYHSKSSVEQICKG